MNIIEQTEEFSDWLRSLKDIRGKARILARLKSAEAGNFGPGYRLYYGLRGKVVYLLLCGDKSSQEKDIVRAKKIFGV